MLLRRSELDSVSANRAWIHVILIFFFMLINYADKAVIGLSSIPIMHDLGLSNSQFGELGSAFFLLFSVSGVLVGFLANHIRTKMLMLTMALVWSLALLPVGMLSSFGFLLTSRIALGAAEGPSFPVAIHAVYKWFDDRDREMPTSVVACGAAFGTGVVAPLLTWIIVHLSWHAAFVALGLTGLGWSCLWYAVAEDGPVGRPPAAARTMERRVPYSRLLSSRTAMGVFLAGFAAYWVIALNITWLAHYLMTSLNLTPADSAWIVGLPSVMQMLLAPCLALFSQFLTHRGLSSRLSRGILGASCVVTAGLSMICMARVEFGILKIVLIGLCFSVGSVIFTLGSTLIGEISPPSQRGAMLGMTNSFHSLAGLCAPLVMGWVVDGGANSQSGFRTGFVYAGVLVAALGLAAALLIEPQADAQRFRYPNALNR